MTTYTPGRASQQGHDLYIEPGTFIDDDDGAEVSVYTLTVDSLDLGTHELHLALDETAQLVIGVVNLNRMASNESEDDDD
jgi:hypothetical protein